MNHSLVATSALLLTLAPLSAQDQEPFAFLAAPAPTLDDGSSLSPALPQAAESQWKSSLNLGATYTSGNTSIRTANLAAEASKEVGLHKTSAFFSWNYAEQKDDTTKLWSLDQRRTKGGAKHQKYFSEAKTTYGFVAVDAENNLNQNVDLRLTGTVGLGRQLINKDDLKFAIELGAGWYSETSRTAGVPDAEFATGRFAWDLDHQINESWQFLNTLKYYFSLEDDRDQYGELDSKLRVSMGEGMFAQAQWVLQWDNTPSLDSTGNKAHSLDHLFLLSVGWSF